MKRIVVLSLLSLFAFLLHANAQGGLSWNYYRHTCPSLNRIVQQTTAQIFSADITLAASLLRLHFHDCFVRGCEASILLNSTANNKAEKDAIPNLTLRGFAQIDIVKAAVEAECPGIVSCADILALVAGFAVSTVGGPCYEVPLGRRDGNVSLEIEALTNLPAPFFNLSQLISVFAAKGLNEKDLVVLSGAHTVGVSHCNSFANRIYNFSSTSNTDPTLNALYALKLQGECPPSSLTTSIVPMDPITPLIFDTNYYLLVNRNMGLFQSDASLLDNALTSSYVSSHSSPSRTSGFFKDFAASILKMGQIGVLTGNQGEIRKICSAIN